MFGASSAGYSVRQTCGFRSLFTPKGGPIVPQDAVHHYEGKYRSGRYPTRLGSPESLACRLEETSPRRRTTMGQFYATHVEEACYYPSPEQGGDA